MVYRKRYRKPRKKYRRKNIFWWRLKNKAMRGGLKAIKYLNVEKKTNDTLFNPTAITNTGTIIQLNNLVQGDTNVTRDGNQVKWLNISARCSLRSNTSATTGTSFRFMLVLDKQPNGAIYTVADLLENVDPSSGIEKNNALRFKVLSSKYLAVNPNGRDRYNWTIFKKLNFKTRYQSNAGTIADISTNALSVMVISDQATNTPNFQAFFRLRFIDN